MADYDLDFAGLCFRQEVYVYCVFFCHLALEKLLKAIVLEELGLEEPPYIHNLSGLSEIAGLDLPEEYAVFLKDLTPYGVTARYPETPDIYNSDLGDVVRNGAREVYSWLRPRLMYQG